MKTKGQARYRAFSLVEVALALAIMSFSLIVLLAILPVSRTTIQNASEETAGINVISTVVCDLKSTPATTNMSTIYGLTLPTQLSGATQPQVLYVNEAGSALATAHSTGAKYKVTITLSAPNSQNTVNGLAQAAWPVQAPNPTTVEAFFALNRN